jgi:hypothetical protein
MRFFNALGKSFATLHPEKGFVQAGTQKKGFLYASRSACKITLGVTIGLFLSMNGPGT